MGVWAAQFLWSSCFLQTFREEHRRTYHLWAVLWQVQITCHGCWRWLIYQFLIHILSHWPACKDAFQGSERSSKMLRHRSRNIELFFNLSRSASVANVVIGIYACVLKLLALKLWFHPHRWSSWKFALADHEWQHPRNTSSRCCSCQHWHQWLAGWQAMLPYGGSREYHCFEVSK